MTPADLDRQRVERRERAERFAQLVDSNDPLPAPGGGHTDDDVALVAIGRRLSAVPLSGQVDPNFRAEFRAVLMAAVEREHAEQAAAKTGAQPDPATAAARLSTGLAKVRALFGSSPQTRRARTRGAIIAAVAVGAIAVTGISSATDDSTPGDTLYGMKRSTERAQLALAADDTSRAKLLLNFAHARTVEADSVRGDPEAFNRLLAETDGQTIEAVALLAQAAIEWKTEAPLDIVASFVDRQEKALNRLTSGTDPAESTRAKISIGVLKAMDNHVKALRAEMRAPTR